MALRHDSSVNLDPLFEAISAKFLAFTKKYQIFNVPRVSSRNFQQQQIVKINGSFTQVFSAQKFRFKTHFLPSLRHMEEALARVWLL